jgi:hypothetical protein
VISVPVGNQSEGEINRRDKKRRTTEERGPTKKPKEQKVAGVAMTTCTDSGQESRPGESRPRWEGGRRGEVREGRRVWAEGGNGSSAGKEGRQAR